MKTNTTQCLYKAYFFVCAFLLSFAVQAQQPINLYVSKQTNQASVFNGTYSKQTDKFEQGTVTLSANGPLSYQVNPADLSIQPNQNKTWNGTISANVAGAPEPGNMTPAQLIVNYDLKYSRPYGQGTNGTVTSTYYCTDNGSAAGNGGCNFHNNQPGAHEMVNDIGQTGQSFNVISIAADIPDTICLGRTGQNNVAVTTFPAAGGTYQWTSMHPSVQIQNANSRIAFIKLLDTTIKNAVVKVEYTIGGVKYSDQGVLSTCECSCRPITTGITAGPLEFTFNAPPDAIMPDGQGNCRYTAANASFNLNLNGIIQRQVQVPGNATVSFGKNCQTGDLTDVKVDWEGDIDIPEIKIKNVSVIKLNVKAIHLTVGTNGNVAGEVTIKATNPEDRDLSLGKGVVMLRKGLNSDVTFKFDNTNGLAGSFDFSGLQGIQIDLVKKDGANDVVIADFSGNMDKDGLLSGNLAVKANATYKTNLFRITMKELTLGIELKVQTGDFKLKSGNGKVQISEMKAVTGTVDLGLNFPEAGGCTATIQAANMTAFSMTLDEFTLQADFNSDFDLTKVQGNLKAKHNSFDAKLTISKFKVENGVLAEFQASGAVKYNAFKFTVQNAAYTATPSELTITARVEINATGAAAMIQVSNFKIKEDGTISVGGIAGSFNKAPASFSFNATFGQNKFSGSFSGSFASIGLDGTIDIGSEEQPQAYNYAYFSITARVNVPLGQSGLKLTQVGGQAGFNYELVFPGGNGQPSFGNYIVGLTLGVSDMADLCQVTGNAVVQFNAYSGNTVLTLNGGIQVMRNNPFFNGNMNVNYRIPQQTIDGSVGATIKVPSSGWIVSTNNCQVNFNIGNGTWSANGNNMGGQMFNGVIQLSGGFINMNGSLSNPTSMTGSLGGQASAAFNYSMSVSALGNTVSGNISLNLNANINANIDQNGLNGSFGVNVSGNGSLTLDTWLGSTTFNGSAVANGNVGYNNGSLAMTGNVDVTLPISIPFWGNQISTGFSISI